MNNLVKTSLVVCVYCRVISGSALVAVYLAVYLDSLSQSDLCEKIASLFSIEASQVIEMFVQGPSGIHILITDEVRGHRLSLVDISQLVV